MIGYHSYDPDHRPLAYVGRIPLTVTNLIIGIYAGIMVLVCFLFLFMGMDALSVLEPMWLNPTYVLHDLEFWRLVTYPFFAPPSYLIWLLIELLMLFWFGSEVERILGRAAFVKFYALLIVAPAILLVIVSFFGFGSLPWQSADINFYVFVGFAIIYPNVELIFGIRAKWFAIFFIGVSILLNLAYRNWTGLIFDFFCLGTTYYYLRSIGISARFGFIVDAFKNTVQRRPSPSSVEGGASVRGRAPSRSGSDLRPAGRGLSSDKLIAHQPDTSPEEEDLHESIDPILEKISQQGVDSLTEKEKRTLEKVRTKLLKTGKADKA